MKNTTLIFWILLSLAYAHASESLEGCWPPIAQDCLEKGINYL